MGEGKEGGRTEKENKERKELNEFKYVHSVRTSGHLLRNFSFSECIHSEAE